MHSSTPSGMGTNRSVRLKKFVPHGDYLAMKRRKGGQIKKSKLYKLINAYYADGRFLNVQVGEKKLPPPAIQK